MLLTLGTLSVALGEEGPHLVGMKRDLATPGDFPGFKAAFYCNLKKFHRD